jgi:acid stress chaperone HdeB
VIQQMGAIMRIAAVATTVAVLLGVTPASAQVVDMSTVTCKDFTGFNKDTTFAVAMWLDAYYRDEDDPPIIDFNKMGQKVGRLAAYCAQNPTHSLTTAAEPIMSK